MHSFIDTTAPDAVVFFILLIKHTKMRIEFVEGVGMWGAWRKVGSDIVFDFGRTPIEAIVNMFRYATITNPAL